MWDSRAIKMYKDGFAVAKVWLLWLVVMDLASQMMISKTIHTIEWSCL
jgi:hypothetical protein